MAEVCNATIESTFLGRESHGILTATLYLKGESWGCGFGGLMTSHVIGFITTVTDVFGEWEKLPGKLVRVEFNGTGASSISRIGHPIKDRWIKLSDVAKLSKEPAQC